MLSVLFEHYDIAVVGLHFAVIGLDPDLDKIALWRSLIRHQVHAHRPHVRGQISAVLTEVGQLRLAHGSFQFWGQNGAEIPTIIPNRGHSMVEISQNAPLVPLDGLVANRYARTDHAAVVLQSLGVDVVQGFHFVQTFSHFVLVERRQPVLNADRLLDQVYAVFAQGFRSHDA